MLFKDLATEKKKKNHILEILRCPTIFSAGGEFNGLFVSFLLLVSPRPSQRKMKEKSSHFFFPTEAHELV